MYLKHVLGSLLWNIRLCGSYGEDQVWHNVLRKAARDDLEVSEHGEARGFPSTRVKLYNDTLFTYTVIPKNT